MNSSSCCSEDGLLVAGYVAESFPALYRNDIGQWAGITNGYLRDLALMLGCEKGVEYKQYTSAATDCTATGCETVLDGALDRGEVLITSEYYYLRPNDPVQYAVTVPALAKEKLLIVEGHVIGSLEETPPSIREFTVFDPDALLLIVILLIICHLIERLYQYLFPVRTTHLRRIWLAVVALGSLALLTFYNALFSGNATSIKLMPRTTFVELINLFHTGSRQLVIDDISHLNEEEIELIGVANIIERPGEQSNIMVEICNNFNYVMFIPSAAITQFSRLPELNTWCILEQIDPPPANFELAPTLIHSMSDGDDCSFLISKKTNRRVLKTANYLLLSVYNWDLKNGLHLRRELPVSQFGFAESVRNFGPPFTIGTRPMNLRHFLYPLVLFAGGLGSSMVVFLLELFPPRSFTVVYWMHSQNSSTLFKFIKML